MATFHENLVQSFTNFKNKYITPIQTALNNKQDKTDNALGTTSKNVVGAINEVNTTLSNKQDKLTNPLTQSDVKNSLTSTSTTTPLSANQGYIMSRDIPWYGTSSTAASTIAKVATTSDTKFALTTGAKVSIKFTYNNTASAPTLNVDSTGAKSIKAYGTTAPTSWWQAGDVVTFTYDGTNWIMGATEGQISQINSDLGGSKFDVLTSNQTDSWVLVYKEGLVQHRIEFPKHYVNLGDTDTIENLLNSINYPNFAAIETSNYSTGQLVDLTNKHLFYIDHISFIANDGLGGATYQFEIAYEAATGKLLATRSKPWWTNTWTVWNITAL